MRNLLFVFGFIGAGLVGAVFARVLFTEEAVLPERSGDAAHLQARVDDLAAELDALRAEVREERASRPLPEMSRLSPGAGVPSGGGTASSPAASASSGMPEHGGSSAPTFVPEDLIEEKVRETVVEIAREQAAERARQAEAQQVAKETAWLKEIQPDINMTDYQVEELGKLLVQRRQVMTAFKQRAANATPDEQARVKQEMANYGEQLHTEVLKVISENQYEALIERARKPTPQGGR